MEIRARYTLIGLFTLGVIAAGFLFVYWLNTGGGLGPRASYRLRFDGPVAGLNKGSAVLFNGVRVGEVTRLELDPGKPTDVAVDIAVERRAPVRSDTRVGIEFQGLAGAPVVALTGGTASLPLLSTVKSPPVLVAEKNAGQGMAQAARDVLRHIDGVVADNAEPLKNLVANVDKFAGALARNTERVDGIMSGLERMTGGGAKPIPRVFDIAAATAFPGLKKRPVGQLLVPDPTALSYFDTDKMLVKGGEKPIIEGAQWPDLAPKVIQARIVQSFENAQYLGAIARVPDVTKAEHQLLLDVRAFDVTTAPALMGEVEIAAKIMTAEGQMVATRSFRATAPVAALEGAAVADALSGAFQKVAAELVTWACGVVP